MDLNGLIRDNERQWARIELPDLRGVNTSDELDPNAIPHHYACSLVNFGGLYEMAGNRARAQALYHRAATWDPGYKPAAAALASMQQPSPAG